VRPVAFVPTVSPLEARLACSADAPAPAPEPIAPNPPLVTPFGRFVVAVWDGVKVAAGPAPVHFFGWIPPFGMPDPFAPAPAGSDLP
jgi:hypothetical protein